MDVHMYGNLVEYGQYLVRYQRDEGPPRVVGGGAGWSCPVSGGTGWINQTELVATEYYPGHLAPVAAHPDNRRL